MSRSQSQPALHFSNRCLSISSTESVQVPVQLLPSLLVTELMGTGQEEEATPRPHTHPNSCRVFGTSVIRTVGGGEREATLPTSTEDLGSRKVRLSWGSPAPPLLGPLCAEQEHRRVWAALDGLVILPRGGQRSQPCHALHSSNHHPSVALRTRKHDASTDLASVVLQEPWQEVKDSKQIRIQDLGACR